MGCTSRSTSSPAGRGPTSSWSRRFQGWDGIAHGGILCTILDEVMAWSLVGEDNWGLTARMNVEFKRPVVPGQALHADGAVTRVRRRLVETSGRIVDPADGTVLVTATAVYVAADEARKRELRERYGYVPRVSGPTAVDTPVVVEGTHG